MNLGKIEGESKADYHGSPAVGSHKLSDFIVSPLLFKRRYVSKEAPLDPSSKALLFGDYFHTLALEGEAVAESRHIILPDDAPDKPTQKMRDAKKPKPETVERIAWWDNFNAEANGRIITKQADRELAWRMVEAIRSKPTARALLARGKPEVTFRKQMASFVVQSRCDWFDETRDDYNRPLIMDVKTIDSLKNFERQFLNYDYYRQCAFYQLVVGSTIELEGIYPRFIFLVCEKDEPFQVALREPDEISMSIGRAEVMRDLAALKSCYDSGVFPGEPDEIRPVSLPDWKITKAL